METNLPKRDALTRMPVWCRRLLVCVVAFLLLVGGIHGYQRYQISVIYAQWRAEGLPTNREELEQYYRPPVGAVDNSAIWLPAIKDASQVDFMAWYSADEDEEETQINLSEEVPPAAGQPWDHQEVVEEFLMDYLPELQALFRAAEAGGQARFPDSVSGSARTASKLLHLESLTARYHRDLPRCLRAIQALLALSNINEGSPDTIKALSFGAIANLGFREAVDLLHDGMTVDQDLAALQKLVCQVDYLEVCRTCRAEDYIDHVEYVVDQSRFPFATANELDMLHRLELLRPAYAKSGPEILSELSSFRDRLQAIHIQGWQSSIRFHAGEPEANFGLFLLIENTATAAAYKSATQSSLNGLLAAERHRLRHGSYPAVISGIDADLIEKGGDGSALLLDPFTGKPLCYRLADTELRIYSVGENLVDDGGNFESVPEKGLVDIGYSVRRK